MNRIDLINLICGVTSMIVYLCLCLIIQLGNFNISNDLLYPAAFIVAVVLFYSFVITATRYHYE